VKISIFGLGYVGAVSAGCLASDGHEVVGVDPNPTKVALINKGITPIIEKDIGEMIATAVAAGRLRATGSVHEAVMASDLSLVCVGTPSQLNGNLDLSYVRRVCEEIGGALRQKNSFHVVVARSTMLPGSMRSVVIPSLEQASGKTAGVDFGVCNNPEFLREGTAVYDYYHPPKTVIGETDAKAGQMLVDLYSKMDAPLLRTDVETAEMVKYADNTWHALKVGFANEIGNICKAVEVDAHKVMEIFCQDTKLNLSPYYLKPGFAFGGSCLPKEVKGFLTLARQMDVPIPALAGLLDSNDAHIDRAYAMIARDGRCKVALFGLAFKPGTDDMRDSPLVALAERLLGKGFELAIFDRFVKLSRLLGKNKEFIDREVPHLDRLLAATPAEALEGADVIVVGHADAETRQAIATLATGRRIVDLAGYADLRSSPAARYEGICW